MIRKYCAENSVRLLVAAVLCIGLMAGIVDPGTALAGGVILEAAPSDLKTLHAEMQKAFASMKENIAKIQDTAEKAREEVRQEGSLHTKTNEKLTELGKVGNELSESLKELKDRVRDVEQKADRRPAGTEQAKSIGAIAIESEQFKAAQKNLAKPNMDPVVIGSYHNAAVSGPGTATTGTTGTLVAPDRREGIIMPGLRRLTIRDLIPARRTDSNMVEFVVESSYTSNAGPQYDGTSPSAGTEGAVKPESALAFTLTQVPLVTLAHFIPASRQILADASGLQSYIDGRLRYGLKLKEEDEMLNGANTNGDLNGINNQATAFTGGVTNQTAIDTLLKAFTQISLSNFDATGVILHPNDWRDILLLKDTTGRYLFADPHNMERAVIWGKDVVATASQSSGTFTAGNFILGAEIVDREDATVRVAEQHADFFVRNMVAILAEERVAICILRAAAIVKGNISFAG